MTDKKPTDSFMAYTSYIRDKLNKPLTEDDVSLIMRFYLKATNPDECVEKIIKGEKK